jgi:predicted dehydrogenase
MGLKIGIVGGGTFGLMHLRTFAQLRREGRVDSVALAEIDEQLLGERCTAFDVRGYSGHREMLEHEDLDGVTVVTPDDLHRRIALDCIAAGRHVLIEKPLDVTVEGCAEIADAADRAGVLVQVDFHKRFDPFHIELRNAITRGDLGRPQYGYAWMEDRIEVPRDWFPQWAPRSSPAWFLGVHMVDLFRWCVGGLRGRRVWASGQKHKLAGLGVDAWDAVQAMVEFDEGVTLHLQTGWALPESFEAVVNQGIRIVGSEGVSEVDSQDRGARMASSSGGSRTFNPTFLAETIGPDGEPIISGYGVESIADFAGNIQFMQAGHALGELAGRYADAREGLEVTRIVEGVHRSLETGRVEEI